VSESDVLSANRSFYRAVVEGDLTGLDELLSRKAPCAVIHPGWPATHGREEVLETWLGIFEGGGPPKLRCDDERVGFLGPDVAFVICGEQLEDASLVATNLFVLEDGAWKLAHHQAGPAPPASPRPASLH